MDQLAFDAVFLAELMKSITKIRGYVNMIAGQEAEDVMQETVAKALRSKHTYVASPVCTMVPWLKRIAHNVYVDMVRDSGPGNRPLTEEGGNVYDYALANPLSNYNNSVVIHGPSEELERMPSVDTDQHRRLEVQEILAAVMALPPGQRPIMESVMLGYSLEEAAERRGCAFATAKNQLLNGRKALRQKFDE